jgi:hypothetical protein
MTQQESLTATSTRRRWVSAPRSARLNVPAVLGVYLLEGESVQWEWTHQSEGSYVSGYQIEAADEAADESRGYLSRL